MSVDNEKKREQDIYDYFKEHPSVLISCISGVVLIIGFIFNTLIYVNECKYLNYWHLDEGLVEIRNPNQIYEMAMVSIFYIAIMLIQCFCSLTLNQYQNKIQISIYGKLLLKSMKKEYKNLEPRTDKSGKKEKKEVKKTEELLENKELLERIEEDIEKYEKSIKSFSKKVINRNLCNVFVAVIISIILLGITYYLSALTSVSGVNWKKVLGWTFLSSSLIWGMSCIGLTIAQWPFNIRFRKLCFEEQVRRFERCMDRYEEDETEYPLKILMEFRVREHINRESVYSLIIYATVIFVTFVGMINRTKEDEIENNRSFNIVVCDNQEYAIIYRDSSYFYLEEVEIIGSEVFVYVDRQRWIAKEDVEIINREFDEVSRIDINGKLLERE